MNERRYVVRRRQPAVQYFRGTYAGGMGEWTGNLAEALRCTKEGAYLLVTAFAVVSHGAEVVEVES